VKHLLFLWSILSISFLGTAQDIDSIAFQDHKWTIQHVKMGIVWKQGHFDDLFGGNQAVNIIEIDLKRYHKKLKLAAVSKGMKPTSEFATENNAIVAINGGFFNTKVGGAHDFIKIDGEIINISSNNHPRSSAYFVFDKKQVQIIPQTVDSIRETAIDNVLLSGPLLLSAGKIVPLGANAFNNNKHPRTAVALRGQTLIFITVDGRNRMSHGVSLGELSRLLKWSRCEAAMNLDGGGSTTMYIKKQSDNGVVNYPSDNKQFDHYGERKVANIIYIKN
jgi:exopolysaccharide biosynthesis protein